MSSSVFNLPSVLLKMLPGAPCLICPCWYFLSVGEHKQQGLDIANGAASAGFRMLGSLSYKQCRRASDRGSTSLLSEVVSLTHSLFLPTAPGESPDLTSEEDQFLKQPQRKDWMRDFKRYISLVLCSLLQRTMERAPLISHLLESNIEGSNIFQQRGREEGGTGSRRTWQVVSLILLYSLLPLFSAVQRC